MFLYVIKTGYVSDYKIQLQFNDNIKGIIDLKNELTGDIFEPLRDINYFKSFYLNNSTHTISWNNGADFAPEFLYEKLTINS